MMYSCREIYKSIGFATWENFNNNVEKAIQFIDSGAYKGMIVKTHKTVTIGFGAKRKIIDYTIDDDALELIKQLSYNKLCGKIPLRNEIVFLTLLKKYCRAKNISFESQYALEQYKYDAFINEAILLEFDEQHHSKGKQKQVDLDKNEIAKKNKLKIIRVGIADDIVDIILKLEKEIGT